MDDRIIGIDLGGTNLRIGAVTEEHEICSSQIIDSAVVAKSEDPQKELVKIIKQFAKEQKIAQIKAVSIGVPSSVANDKETVIYTTNLRNAQNKAIFHNTNLASYLREYLTVPVYVNNDTNNLLLYDVYKNGVEKEPVIAGIYIGTGVGASVLIDGKSFDGANGAALDIGHLPYFKGTEKCSCAKYGCCECYTSGWKLQKIRAEYFPSCDISDLFLKHKEELPMKEFLYSCAHVFAVMATVFNPNAIIAGGGVIEMEGFPRKEFEKLANENTGLDVMSYGLRYIYSEPLAEKGVIGAALFAEKKGVSE